MAGFIASFKDSLRTLTGWRKHGLETLQGSSPKQDSSSLPHTSETQLPLPALATEQASSAAKADGDGEMSATQSGASVAAPATKQTFLQKLGNGLRKVLGLAVQAAVVAEPIVDLSVPAVAGIYNTTVGLAVSAEAVYGSTPGQGPAKLALVSTALIPAAEQWAKDNNMSITSQDELNKWASAIADSLNKFPFTQKTA